MRWYFSILAWLVLELLLWRSHAGGFEPLSVMCEVNGIMVPAIIDTGAEITVMSAACAKRCGLSKRIDTQHSGRAVGVGSSVILGGIEGLSMRIGPLSFQSKVSVLKNSQCEFLIGMDLLSRFKCDISVREKMLKMHVRDQVVRIGLGPASIALPKETLLVSRAEKAPSVPDVGIDATRDDQDDCYDDEDCLYDYDDGQVVSMEGV